MIDKEKIIKEIASILDESRYVVFLDKETGEILKTSNELSQQDDYYADTYFIIQSNLNRYIKFEKPTSKQTFKLMESFAAGYENDLIRNKLLYSLALPKPFRNFRNEIKNMDDDVKSSWDNFRINYLYTQIQDKLHAFFENI